jgi:hypothetical protein
LGWIPMRRPGYMRPFLCVCERFLHSCIATGRAERLAGRHS